MAHSVQNVTLALTLPISCHICLGKVRQPVICANSHVFCSVCIKLWLKNNSHCPACRVPITEESPCKNIIGGTSEDEGSLTHSGRKHLRKTRLELLQKEYEDEIESLIKETEELKRANVRLEERLGDTTGPAALPGFCNCRHKGGEDRKGFNDDLLEEWSRKLEMVEAANKKVVEDVEKLKVENRKLRNENIECVRENLRLKNEVDLRSPQKFGRFTVAALQAKVDQYEREMNRLKKALERSDQYIEELEAQAEQMKRPQEVTQKEKSPCRNIAHVHIADATTTHTCQERNATQQLSNPSRKTGICSEGSSSTCSNSNGHLSGFNNLKSICENVGSPEQNKKFSRFSSSLLNNSEQMSMNQKSQREGAELAQGLESPTSLLPFSALHLNTPDGKANCSFNHGQLKKPLTYLRKLVFDDLPKSKELCKSNTSNSESRLTTGKGICIKESKPSLSNFCQIKCDFEDGKLIGQENIGLRLGRQKDNSTDEREYPEANQIRTSAENSMDEDGDGNVSELNTHRCNGRIQSSCHSKDYMSASKINFQSISKVKVDTVSEDIVSSHQGGEPIASVSHAACSLSAIGDGEYSLCYVKQPAGAIQDKNFQGHLPHTDTLLCEPSLQSKEKLIFHSASGEAECTGHASSSTMFSQCIIQSYSHSPPAKRKMLNQTSDSPSKLSKP